MGCHHSLQARYPQNHTLKSQILTTCITSCRHFLASSTQKLAQTQKKQSLIFIYYF